MATRKRLETATAEPALERAVQSKTEKRRKRGSNKRILHPVRPEDVPRD
jgi:hypothetical protein